MNGSGSVMRYGRVQPLDFLTSPFAVNYRGCLSFTLLFALLFAFSEAPRHCCAQVFQPDPSLIANDDHPRAGEFRKRDRDQNAALSEEEFVSGGGADKKVLQRNFRIFDFDRDGRLNLSEFVTVPFGQADQQRGMTPDPIIQLSAEKRELLLHQWNQWDTDSDDRLSSAEFTKGTPASLVRGMNSTTFVDWDLDRDQFISRDEVARVLDIAFGVCTPNGIQLRSNTGRILDWIMFRGLKKDENGMVSKADYFNVLGPGFADREIWFDLIDKNHDGQFDLEEFSKSNHSTDPVTVFLNCDQDFNGVLSVDELELLPAERFPVANFLIPAFDDNRDGSLSLSEFQFSPVNNLLVIWNQARDKNEDGKLSFEEFRYDSGIVLTALCAEYFQRLDTNHDRLLSLDEFEFETSNTSDRQRELRVENSEGSVLLVTIPEYPNIGSPQLSPDGKWLAVDGSKEGQNDAAAHVLLINLASDEVLDLGSGCLPHWSADGRRIGYSKYSGGVYIRNVEAIEDDEELIDSRGWSICFSPDGKYTAYTKGGNLVLLNHKTHEKRMLFDSNKFEYSYIEWNFVWSPDSERVCFKARKADGTIDVCIASIMEDGPALRVRCSGKDVRTNLAWHPDGKRIMFPRFAAPGRREQIFEIPVDGDEPARRYVKQPRNRNNINQTWSKDGKLFVYLTTP
ncbi:EF-hand domain-containing protein [Schlesneria sp. T3-172]|uniref:EF-hand domain-containing protein n=1 Tax=Schlesneria sphaerica TaxID=3373610 RepID=UPI0037C64518